MVKFSYVSCLSLLNREQKVVRPSLIASLFWFVCFTNFALQICVNKLRKHLRSMYGLIISHVTYIGILRIRVSRFAKFMISRLYRYVLQNFNRIIDTRWQDTWPRGVARKESLGKSDIRADIPYVSNSTTRLYSS